MKIPYAGLRRDRFGDVNTLDLLRLFRCVIIALPAAIIGMPPASAQSEAWNQLRSDIARREELLEHLLVRYVELIYGADDALVKSRLVVTRYTNSAEKWLRYPILNLGPFAEHEWRAPSLLSVAPEVERIEPGPLGEVEVWDNQRFLTIVRTRHGQWEGRLGTAYERVTRSGPMRCGLLPAEDPLSALLATLELRAAKTVVQGDHRVTMWLLTRAGKEGKYSIHKLATDPDRSNVVLRMQNSFGRPPADPLPDDADHYFSATSEDLRIMSDDMTYDSIELQGVHFPRVVRLTQTFAPTTTIGVFSYESADSETIQTATAVPEELTSERVVVFDEVTKNFTDLATGLALSNQEAAGSPIATKPRVTHSESHQWPMFLLGALVVVVLIAWGVVRRRR